MNDDPEKTQQKTWQRITEAAAGREALRLALIELDVLSGSAKTQTRTVDQIADKLWEAGFVLIRRT